jgi:transposase
MLRMDQVHVVRHKVLVEGVSIRKVARDLGISRNTVRRYVVEGAAIGERAAVTRASPVLDVVKPRIEALLGESPRWTGGKQRLTATQFHRLVRGEGLEVGVTLIKEYVAEWKRQRREVFVPLVYHPGDLAEVDFFEVLVDVEGKRQKAWMFLMRLMHSGRDFAWLYPRQDQVCFLDGHARAFEHFGAVPQRLVYDNLRAAVARVLCGAERQLAPRFLALATHYVFEACFARPRTGHDKGGVEARGKGIRLQHLVPIPSGPDLATMSQQLVARLDARSVEHRDPEGRSIAERFAEELPRMLPLPERVYRAAAVVSWECPGGPWFRSRARPTPSSASGQASTSRPTSASTRSRWWVLTVGESITSDTVSAPDPLTTAITSASSPASLKPSVRSPPSW